MEQPIKVEPSGEILQPHIKNLALQYANQFFDNAYEGQPFNRITVEDMDALINNPDFYDVLLCVDGGGQGDTIKAALKKYNDDRRKVATDSMRTLRALDSEGREELFQQIWELHERPPKPQSVENPDMF
jgi:hypothetical protein